MQCDVLKLLVILYYTQYTSEYFTVKAKRISPAKRSQSRPNSVYVEGVTTFREF